MLARQERRRLTLQVGKLIHVIVEWGERTIPGVA